MSVIKETYPGDVSNEGEFKHPVQLDVFVLQHVSDRALGTVTPYKADVARLDTRSYQLVHVRVFQAADLDKDNVRI